MFQFYEGTTSENTSPRITVRKGGQLVLTRGAVEMLGEGTTHVQIGYDAETKVVGLKAAAEDAKGRYRLRTQGTNGLHVVTGKRFFAHYGLEIGKARTFTAETFEGGIVSAASTLPAAQPSLSSRRAAPSLPSAARTSWRSEAIASRPGRSKWHSSPKRAGRLRKKRSTSTTSCPSSRPNLRSALL